MEWRNCRRCGRVFDGTPYTTTTYDAAAFLRNTGGGGQTPITVWPQECPACVEQSSHQRGAMSHPVLTAIAVIIGVAAFMLLVGIVLLWLGDVV